jgi:hypothetical protein
MVFLPFFLLLRGCDAERLLPLYEAYTAPGEWQA